MRCQFVFDCVHKRLDDALHDGNQVLSDCSQTVSSHVIALLPEPVLIKHVDKLAGKAREAQRVELRRVQIGVLLGGDGR